MRRTCYIVDVALDDEPVTVGIALVLAHLGGRVLLGHGADWKFGGGFGGLRVAVLDKNRFVYRKRRNNRVSDGEWKR